MALFTCHWRKCTVQGEISGDGSTPFSHDGNGQKVFFCTQEHVGFYEVEKKTQERVRAAAAQQARQQAAAPEMSE